MTLARVPARLACGLLAATHLALLLRTTRSVLEQGPTPVLVATGTVLFIGVLVALAAGPASFRPPGPTPASRVRR